MLSTLGRNLVRALRKDKSAVVPLPDASRGAPKASVRVEDVPGLHRLFPDDAVYGALLALELARRGDAPQALTVLDRLEAGRGPTLETAVARARILGEQGDRAAAITALERFAIDAEDAGVQVILAENYYLAGRLDDADRAYAAALARNPHSFAALTSRTATAGRLGKIETATECARRALRYDPRSRTAWSNLHWAYCIANRFEDERSVVDRALDLFPDDAEYLVARGMLRLLRGDFGNGWTDFDARMRDARAYHFRPSLMERPVWRGEPFRDKTLLVFGEQGAGDNIMMARYLPRVKALGGKVVYECAETLHELLATAGGVDQSIPRDVVREPRVRFDLWTPVMTLARTFAADLGTIPHDVPYLHVSEDARRFWKGLTRAEGDALRVGLAWSGNPSHANDFFRSIPIDLLAPLMRVPGVVFHRMQLEGPRDVSAHLPRVRDLTEHVITFTDTAALVEQMDLVITVDTSIAHVAGALGRPTWVLLPFRPDWRWLLDRPDSPWYPTARLFRQPRLLDWRAVIDEVCGALRELVRHRRSRIEPPVQYVEEVRP
jgi:tetratricopeptide (TPR) repeat protein